MTDSIQPDNLIALNINEKGLTARYRLMSAYAATGDVQNAENVFSAIPVDFQLSENEQTEYELMSQFTAIQFSLIPENKTWFSLLPEQKSTLETLAENGKSLAAFNLVRFCLWFTELFTMMKLKFRLLKTTKTLSQNHL
jgi:hypothetical protein